MHLAGILFAGMIGIAALTLGVIIVVAWVVERRHDIMGDSTENDWFV